jgi:glucosamine--fructose-6-phosphate aminotransferase (isomerizing)
MNLPTGLTDWLRLPMLIKRLISMKKDHFMNNKSEQGYLADILAQPAALDATHAGLVKDFDLGSIPTQLRDGKFRRVVLTGMGSSHSIFYPLYYQLVEQGLPVTLIEASELIHYASGLVQGDSLVITASQSGSSAETVRLLEITRARAATVLGISNTPGSPLATQADICLLTRAGTESTVSCKTYVAALAALRWLQAGLLGEDLSEATRETEQVGFLAQNYLKNWQEHVQNLQAELAGTRDYFITGRGPSLAAVLTGSLTIKESTLQHGEGLSCAALRHGPLEMMRNNAYVLVFSGSKNTYNLNYNLAKELSAQGARVGWVSPDAEKPVYRLPRAPEGLLPIMEFLPTAMLNLAIAALSNHQAGVFEHATKITVTE